MHAGGRVLTGSHAASLSTDLRFCYQPVLSLACLPSLAPHRCSPSPFSHLLDVLQTRTTTTTTQTTPTLPVSTTTCLPLSRPNLLSCPLPDTDPAAALPIRSAYSSLLGWLPALSTDLGRTILIGQRQWRSASSCRPPSNAPSPLLIGRLVISGRSGRPPGQHQNKEPRRRFRIEAPRQRKTLRARGLHRRS